MPLRWCHVVIWEPVVKQKVQHSSCNLPLSLSISEPLGSVLWTAQTAYWSMRNSLTRRGNSSYDSFMCILIKLVFIVL